MAMANCSWEKGRSSELARTKEMVCRRLSGRTERPPAGPHVQVDPDDAAGGGSVSPDQPPLTTADLQHIPTGENDRLLQVEYFRSLEIFLDGHMSRFYFIVFFFTGGFINFAGSTWTVISAGEMME